MRRKRGALSIRVKILLLFVLSLLIAVSSFAELIFSSWTAYARESTRSNAERINEDLYDQVSSFVQAPFQMNEVSRNLIEHGMVDLDNALDRDRYFAWILDLFSGSIDSLGYGTARGEYYGARRDEDGSINMIRSDEETGGKTWVYALNEDFTAGALLMEGDPYDPRTRAWYTAALEAGQAAYSPIYSRNVSGERTVSAAQPIYDRAGELQGVLGTHLLLADLDGYLQKIVGQYQGVGFIIDTKTHELIANSLGLPNYTVLADGTVKRFAMTDIEDPDIQNAYRQYTLNSASQQIFRGESDDYFINARDMNPGGIDWTVVSAIPQSIFIGDIDAGMAKAGIVATVSMVLAIAIYSLFMRRTLKPMQTIMTVTNDLSEGNLSSRVDIVRDDELGIISQGVNSVADKMQSLVENLESLVDQRTQELQSAFQALGETKDKLLLILDTAAEAIYGINLEGACTFCNTSCVKMLGYSEYKDLLHHNMHELIHHAREDGSPLPENECKIHLALSRGEKVHVEDEVFWRADGSPISVEYYSYPQIKDGRVIGAVITFMDIGERKKREAQIHYLSCYDPLTGLHNRRCFDENRVLIDTESNLPLSVIFADLNGLKMTNDIFGHAAGDELIRVSSEILQNACRQEDLIARIGGDEFIILLPKTNTGSAMKVLSRIREGFADVQVKAVKGSISLGLSTKTGADQPLDEVMANAENAMYKDKSVNRKNNSKDMINTIIDTLHTKNPREKRHSLAVADLSERIGSAMNLPDDQLVKLRQAGYLHDIGKIILDDSILAKDTFTAEEIDAIRQHPAAGYRILSLFDDMLDIAEFVYAHHERWDGTGFPRGIKGEQMPLISRIIAVAEVYDRVAHKGGLQPEGFEESGLDAIRNGAGTKFDPKVAETFLRIIEDNEEEV